MEKTVFFCCYWHGAFDLHGLAGPERLCCPRESYLWAAGLMTAPAKTAAQRQHKRRARDKAGIEVWDTPVRADRITALLMATVPPRLTEEAARDPGQCR